MVKNNKYAMRDCDKYNVDLKKMSRMNDMRAKRESNKHFQQRQYQK